MCFEYAGRVLIGGASMASEAAPVSVAATTTVRMLCLDGVVFDGVALRGAAGLSVDDSLNGGGVSETRGASLLRRCDPDSSSVE